jgi:hypothetical protein
VTVDTVDTVATAEALKALRRARRRNRIADIHWIDALYNVYLTAVGGIIFVLFASSKVDDQKLSTSQVAHLADKGPAILGLVIAFAVAFGLRSGGRGGPLTLEAPVVHHELMAPIPHDAVVRGPAIKQLRFISFASAVVGAIVGVLASRQLPGNPVPPVIFCAATFSLAGVLAIGTAMLVSGRQLGWWVANGIAAVVLAWSVADIATGYRTSPLTWLAGLAFWSIRFTPIAFVSVALVAVVAVLGVLGIGELSIEAARRRAGLVSQLRFAVTLQDLRTVVLLRRQLSQEKPRSRPWIRMGRGGRLPPIWRRDWQGLLRFPGGRLIRMAVLGVVAGLCLGLMWRGTTAMFVLAGLALFLAAYDAVEPLAQEIDHPTRWESFPDDYGRILLLHLPTAIITMVFVCGIAALASLVWVPGSVVGSLAMPMVLVVGSASAFGAAVSTALGMPSVSGLIGLGQDLMGVVLAARLVIPPAIVVVSLMPLLLAGSNPAAIATSKVDNAAAYPFFALFGAGMWLRYRKPSHL